MLTLRSSSVIKTVYWRSEDPWLRLASYIDWGASLYYPMLRKFFDTFFQGDFPKYGKKIYAEHYRKVYNLVPTERLLEYNIRDGWGPLCRFLGEDVPCGEAFPHFNDTQSFVARCQRRNMKQIGNALFRYLLTLVVIVIISLTMQPSVPGILSVTVQVVRLFSI